MKVDLDFNVDSLRITDLGEDDQDQASGNSANAGNNVLDQIKRNNQSVSNETPDEGKPAGKVRAEADSTALRAFLGGLGSE